MIVADETEQTTPADDANGAPDDTAAPAGADATDDDGLEAALAEYESKLKDAEKPPETPDTPAGKAPADLESKVDRLLKADEDRKRDAIARDMDKAVQSVRGDFPPDTYTDGMVEAWINERANADPRIQQAWLDRHTNPTGFQRALKGLSKEFAKGRASQIDETATQDAAAVAAAVRGGNNAPPADEMPKFGKASDSEYAAEVEKKFGYRPAV